MHNLIIEYEGEALEIRYRNNEYDLLFSSKPDY